MHWSVDTDQPNADPLPVCKTEQKTTPNGKKPVVSLVHSTCSFIAVDPSTRIFDNMIGAQGFM